MALRLLQLGYREVFALEGGFDAWVKRALPTEMKSGAMLGQHAP